ncbi:uncharacterized protein [Chelonus insularis]|uniref:uncharacterized protein n=1 Tax=Chelonus insularis TaxID=460826 RepID=UPI00158D50C9|nr:uncharacterized protein LOC118065557 [Chelonus insularis]
MRSIEIILVAGCVITLANSLPISERDLTQTQPVGDLVLINENEDPTLLRSKRAINFLKRLFPQIPQNIDQEVKNEVQEEDAIEISPSENNEVKVPYQDADEAANEAVQSELTPLENIEVGDDENRNKRSGSENSGGSGNFLFDIIRLITSSGSSSGGDNSHCSNCDGAGAKHEPDEAVPGPATRFLVIANRGLSNLIQDLILRIAATSERFVNFKARLITSII